MVNGIGQCLENSIIAMLIIVAVLSVFIGGLAVWCLPKLWDLVKPFIHSVTA